jgi:hypothetical protein
MKKILLITLASILYYSSYSQILSASTSAEFQTWSVQDVDGDTYTFGIYDLTGGTLFPTQGEILGSRSYDPNATPTGLSPDNYAISPAMDLSSFSSINLSYKVFSNDNTFFDENYTIYITNDLATGSSYIPITSERLTAGQQIFNRSFSSITTYAGSNEVYILIRHHDCFDENILFFDDIVVTGTGNTNCNLTASSSSTDVSSSGASDGTATALSSGGASPYTYSWSPSGGTNSTATNLSAGAYTCTIIDANNCSVTTTTTVGTSSCTFSSSITSTDETSLNANDGTATVTVSGGTSPYTYSWSPTGGTSNTATNLSPGTYTCTVTDANSCTSAVTATVNADDGCDLTATANVGDVSAPGANDGAVNITVSNGQSPYTYSWYPNISSGPTASNLSAGSYVIDITDANGCTFTVTENVKDFICTLGANSSSSDVSTIGASDGTASVTATQGTAPYSYLWSPGGLTGLFQNGLSKGTYNVTITDANNCSVGVTIIINDPGCSGLSVTSTSTNESFIGSDDGTATVTASGGTSPYSYAWSPSGGSSATATNLSPDVYTAIVIDDLGCSATSVITIESGQPVSVEEEKEEVLTSKAYPNPTNNYLNIEVNTIISDVYILNLNGQRLFTNKASSKNISIDVSNLSSGIYFYQLKTVNGGFVTNRFVKN